MLKNDASNTQIDLLDCDKPEKLEVDNEKTKSDKGKLSEKVFTLEKELTNHNKSVESQKKNVSNTQIHFIVDCGESGKFEDIKQDINEEETVEDPITSTIDQGG